MSLGLITFGEFYNDHVFLGLRRLPRPGEEIYSTGYSRSPGGGAAITALAAANLGVRTGIVTAVGRKEQLDPLSQAGIDIRRCAVDPAGRSPVTVSLSLPTDRCLITAPGVNAEFERILDPLRLEPYLRRARHAHLCFRPRRYPPLIGLLERLRRAGTTVSFDFGWHPGMAKERGFRGLLKRAALFFPNEAEARAITGLRDPAAMVAALAGWTPQPVVKLGAAGAMTWEHGHVLHVRAPRVKVVDTTGAGDVFNAGFLAAWLGKRPLEECLLRANRAAAASVTVPGGMLPAAGRLEKRS